jgi:hypothetical protein
MHVFEHIFQTTKHTKALGIDTQYWFHKGAMWGRIFNPVNGLYRVKTEWYYGSYTDVREINAGYALEKG